MASSFLVSLGLVLIAFSPVPVHPREILPQDFCPLPQNFGYKGSTKFVEDCENLDIYTNLPIPGQLIQKYGIHPIVCCPKTNKKNIHPICFPSDEGCPSRNDSDSDNDQDQHNRNKNVPKISDEDCSAFTKFWGNSTQCVNLKDCPGLFSQPFNPSATKNPVNAKLCGWDDQDKTFKVCCPQALVETKTSHPVLLPRFSGYQCKDKVKECQRWKNNNGCRTDMDFAITPEYNVSSSLMFDFTIGACMETCQRCGSKGCRDEHLDCGEWARRGFCVTRPKFMVHTCRESCGVCGFLSDHDTRDQVVRENSYTDLTSQSFDCGRYKKEATRDSRKSKGGENGGITSSRFGGVLASLSVFLNTPASIAAFPVSSLSRSGQPESSYVIPNSDVLKFCGSTLISDRWVLTAAHCYDDFDGAKYKQPTKVKIATIRDGKQSREVVDIKRVYLHPKYSYPTLYNDIALLELGRRVEYNWDKYGDSPMCLDRDGRNDGRIATIQGYGQTVEGTSGDLKEVKVVVINNTRCKEMLVHNTTHKPSIQAKIKRSFPNGFNKNVFCAQGISDEQGVIRNSCQGDGGGPLFVETDDGRQKLVGIVSGGIGCGQGFPGWFTKVAPFASWIDCIVDNANIYNNKEKIENVCQGVADTVDEEAFDGNIFEDNEDDFEDEIFEL